MCIFADVLALYSCRRGRTWRPDVSWNSDLDVSVHGCGLRSPDQALQLRTAVVFGLHRQLFDVYVGGQQVVLTHLCRVDVEDLNSSLFVR